MMEFVDLETYCMGTNIIQRIYGDKGSEVVKLVETELKRLEGMLSFHSSFSEVSLINERAGFEYVPVSNETLYIINKAKKYSELSSGAFDITAAPLIGLWGVFSEKQRVPLYEEIKEAQELIGHRDIIIDDRTSSIKLAKYGQKIDLGGIAKGFAADRAVEIYKNNGINSAFINIGGNVLVLGNKPDGTSWNIGIQNPLETRGECIGAVAVSDKTVVTSGDYVRYFEKNNVRYHHILDPRTGYPSSSEVMSVTVIGESSIDADAVSTAAFILGLEEGMKFIESMESVHAVFITKNKKVYATEGIRDSFIFTGHEKGFNYINQ
ncbi:MAG: FAD:protein FMN transferase [Bacillota bacterium]|nr:FAD:protein FMN transferase [Bacillota bacterium]